MTQVGEAATAPEDFVSWVTASQPRLLRSAFLLTRDLHAAEDLVQEALVKVAKRWGSLHDQRPTAYARTILYRDYISWWRRRRATPVANPPERPGQRDEDLVERRMLLTEALGCLTAKQRAVLVLRYYDDLSVQETATVLGIGAGTVKRQASVALGHLRGQPALDSLRGLEDAP